MAVEALSSGVPVIASKIGGLTDIVSHEEVGFLVSPGDVNMLANYMVRLLENDEERKKFSINARKRALETFSWSKIGVLVDQLYSDLCQNRTN